MSPSWGDRFRPHLANVTPYASARRSGARGLLLDANENALGPVTGSGSDCVTGAGGVNGDGVAFDAPADSQTDSLHRYPDPSGGALRPRLATYLGVPADRLWIGSGADDAIDVLVRTLLDPGDELVTISPTYDLYAQRATAHGASVRAVRLDDAFDLDVDATVDAARGAQLVILCSPNNPTGRLLSRERVLAVLERTEAVVAVDEAYVEFAGDVSLARTAGGDGTGNRLAVIRTFSKAWGLAGLRTGYLVGDAALVDMMDVVGLPYRLTTPAIRLATAALEAREEMERRTEWLRAERGRVAEGLSGIGLRVLPSDANFLLFFVRDPAEVQRRLAEDHAITIRRRDGQPGLAGALRVTIGTAAQNDRFITAMEEVIR